MISKKILRYKLESEDGRVFDTRQPYTMFIQNKIVKITRVIFMIFKKVIYIQPPN